MICRDCPYRYRMDDEVYPRCHFIATAPGELAPCEYDDEEYYEEDD